MKIAVVKTCDGLMFFSTKRDAYKYGAVRVLIEQITNWGEALFDMEGDEPSEAVKKLTNAGNQSYKIAVEEGWITEATVIGG